MYSTLSVRSKSVESFVTLLAVISPLCLLLDLKSLFYLDWGNHLWQLEYFAEHLRRRGSLPIMLNAIPIIGIPYPIFYGVFFFPLAALPTMIFGAGITVRLLCVGFYLLQFRYVYRATESVTRDYRWGLVVATIVNFAVYPLSNLYNRSALPELFATSLLTCAVASWFLFLDARTTKEKVKQIVVGGLFMVLASGIHPVTAVFGCLALGVIGLATIAFISKPRLVPFLALLGVLIAGALALSPWLYMTTQFESQVQVVRGNLPHYYEGLDELSTRFFPLPVDKRSIKQGLQLITPYLDAQINVPLFLLGVGLFLFLLTRKESISFRSRWGVLLAVSALGFCVTLMWSLESVGVASIFLPVVKFIQIAYRLITYQNLFLLTGVWALLHLSRNLHAAPLFKIVLTTVCLTLAGAGLFLKLVHGEAVERFANGTKIYLPPDQGGSVNDLPNRFYGYQDYSVVMGLPLVDPKLEDVIPSAILPIGRGKDFAIPGGMWVEYQKPTLVRLNIQTFPWNQLLVDGKELSKSALAYSHAYLAAEIPAGKHFLSYRLVIDPLWLLLRKISFGILGTWSLLTAVMIYLTRQRASEVYFMATAVEA